jgi:hypothetical protein
LSLPNELYQLYLGDLEMDIGGHKATFRIDESKKRMQEEMDPNVTLVRFLKTCVLQCERDDCSECTRMEGHSSATPEEVVQYQENVDDWRKYATQAPEKFNFDKTSWYKEGVEKVTSSGDQDTQHSSKEITMSNEKTEVVATGGVEKKITKTEIATAIGIVAASAAAGALAMHFYKKGHMPVCPTTSAPL